MSIELAPLIELLSNQTEVFVSSTEKKEDWDVVRDEFIPLYEFLIEDDGSDVIQENVLLVSKILEQALNKKVEIEFEHNGGRGVSFYEIKGIKLT